MADDFAGMTPDEARARLVRDGANMLPDVKDRLTTIASGMDAPGPRPEMMMAYGPGGRGTHAILVEDFIEQSADDLNPVLCNFPKRLEVAMPDHTRVIFDVGVRPVPQSMVEPDLHPYLKANRVERADKAKASPVRQVDRGESFPTDYSAQTADMERVIVDLTMKLSRAESRIAELEDQLAETQKPAKPAADDKKSADKK